VSCDKLALALTAGVLRGMAVAFDADDAAGVCVVCRPRENLEGEYSGLEHEVVDGVVESLKVSAVYFEITGGAHPPPAGHTQRSRVNSTAGGRRQSLTDEGRLTHPISGGAQRLDQKQRGA
jgi:hypothetical protein